MGVMIQVGRVRGREVRDGALMLQVSVTEEADVRLVEALAHAGDDFNPPDDSLVLIVSVSSAYRLALPINEGIVATVSPGERKLYSSSGGAIKSFIYLKGSGSMELNGNGDFAVRFNELETAFNELKSDLNAHTHPGVQAGTGSTGASTPASTASISAAKVNTVELPV